MLDDLVSTINEVKQKIHSHIDELSQNENRTKTVLIEPVLNVLGWNVTDPNVVKIEYETNQYTNERVDYALFNDSKPLVVIEAKKLNGIRTKHASDIVNYANFKGIQFAILTDGDVWEMYDVFKVKELRERKVLDVQLSSIHSASCALSLLLIWRSNIEFESPTKAQKPIITRKGKTESPPILHQLWSTFTEFDPPLGSTHPERVRFWDESEASLNSWRDLFIQCVIKVAQSGHLTEQQVPRGISKRSYYVNTEPYHPTRTQFYSPYRIQGTELVVEAHGNAQILRKRIRDLWKLCNLSLSELHIKT